MRHLRVVILVAVLLLAGSTVVFASEFKDVPKSMWCYSYIDELSDRGIINGRGGSIYAPDALVTKTEALKLVLQASGIEVGNYSNQQELQDFWGTNILRTAEYEGIAYVPDEEKNAYATREEICQYMVKAQNWEAESHMESVFADSDSDNAEILYQKGIVTGTRESKGYYFNPEGEVTRAETAALIYRLYHYDPLELRPLMGEAEGYLVANPVSVEEWEQILLYMAKNNLTTYTVKYTGLASNYAAKSKLICNNACAAFGNTDAKSSNSLYARYHEYMCFTNNCSASVNYANGQFSVTMEVGNSNFSSEEIRTQRSIFLETAKDAAQDMIDKGLITADMTDKEKAKVVFDFICYACEYDRSSQSKIAPESYTGYGAAINGIAVCQGYTAYYNAILKHLGIWCRGISGAGSAYGEVADHIWTLANIDGEILHIDVTYGDTATRKATAGNYQYFCKTDREFASNHTWW